MAALMTLQPDSPILAWVSLDSMANRLWKGPSSLTCQMESVSLSQAATWRYINLTTITLGESLSFTALSEVASATPLSEATITAKTHSPGSVLRA